MNIQVEFGQVVREQRLALNLSQVELGKKCGLDRTFISLIERGIRQPTLNSLFQIASALDTTPSDLLTQLEARLRRSRWSRLKN
jgi:transcriptional regulator with XRE-family HTH domain